MDTSWFAAIAYSPETGKVGYSYECADKPSAEQIALRYCHGHDARVVVLTENGVCALALGKDQSSWGTACGKAKDDVMAMALVDCKARTSDCYIALAVSTQEGVLFQDFRNRVPSARSSKRSLTLAILAGLVFWIVVGAVLYRYFWPRDALAEFDEHPCQVLDVGPAFAVSPDDRWLAANGRRDSIVLRSLTDSGDRFELMGFRGSAAHIVFTPDGRYLVSGHSPHELLACNLIVWDLAKRSEVARTVVQHELQAIAISPDGKRVAIASGKGVFSYPLPSLGQNERFPIKEYILPSPNRWFSGIAFQGTSNRLVVCVSDRSDWTAEIQILDGDVVIQSRSFEQQLFTFAMAPDGKTIAVGKMARDNSGRKETLLLNAETLELERTIPERGPLAFSPDSKSLAIGNNHLGSTATIYRVTEGKWLQALKDGQSRDLETSATSAVSIHTTAALYFKGGEEMIVSAVRRSKLALNGASDGTGVLYFYKWK